MRFFNIILLTLWTSILLISCSENYSLDKQLRTKLTFSQLPDTIKYYYLKTIEPRLVINEKGDSLKNYDTKDQFICLDNDIKNCKYEIKWKFSFVDKYIFQIDDKTLTMEFNGNTINEPYIIFKKEFYFIVTKNAWDKDEIKNAEYGKFNLTDVLKK